MEAKSLPSLIANFAMRVEVILAGKGLILATLATLDVAVVDLERSIKLPKYFRVTGLPVSFETASEFLFAFRAECHFRRMLLKRTGNSSA